MSRNGSSGTNTRKKTSMHTVLLPPTHHLPALCYCPHCYPESLSSQSQPNACIPTVSIATVQLCPLEGSSSQQALGLLTPTLSQCSWVIVFHKGQHGDLTAGSQHKLEKLHIAFLWFTSEADGSEAQGQREGPYKGSHMDNIWYEVMPRGLFSLLTLVNHMPYSPFPGK